MVISERYRVSRDRYRVISDRSSGRKIRSRGKARLRWSGRVR